MPKTVKSLDQAISGEISVGRPGTLAIGEITLPETKEIITLISMYSVWGRSATEMRISWIEGFDIFNEN